MAIQVEMIWSVTQVRIGVRRCRGGRPSGAEHLYKRYAERVVGGEHLKRVPEEAREAAARLLNA